MVCGKRFLEQFTEDLDGSLAIYVKGYCASGFIERAQEIKTSIGNDLTEE